jgi:hypothetical protein
MPEKMNIPENMDFSLTAGQAGTRKRSKVLYRPLY